MLSLLLATLLSLAAVAADPDATDPDAAVDAVLDDFTQGAAARDIARVERALHPEARQYVAMPDGLQVMDTATYLGLLRAEKLGGTPTSRQTHGIEIDGGHALARQTRDLGAMKLHDAVTLVQADGRWQIVSVSVQVEAK